MNRAIFLEQVLHDELWDLAVVGGGATGLGIALDAATRHYRVVLFEQSDFGKGTSSRSTKLVHGGVRYLQQGNISLVMEALKERGILFRNAPHLVRILPFVVPNYRWWEAPFYGIGLKVYDLLAGKHRLGRSTLLSRQEVLERIPTLQQNGLRSGVLYYDGQFDDSRLLINLAQTAVEQGACLLNAARVVGLLKNSGMITGLTVVDEESGRQHHVRARCVINATGPFADELRREDDCRVNPMLALSQGVHLVLDHSFLPGDTALMAPRTRDKRVMFAIPWKGHVVLGTTDTPIPAASLEPQAREEEIQLILETAGRYLARRPERDDILSVFTGIRPLVDSRRHSKTAALSRDHVISISKSGLLTITGGKWTTYRKMAEECLDQAIVVGHLEARPCVTETLEIHGAGHSIAGDKDLEIYGADGPLLEALMRERPELAERLDPTSPIRRVQVIWAVRQEMARTVDDILARRTGALYLNARAALAMAPAVARLMAQELGRDEAWQNKQVEDFKQIAAHFTPSHSARAEPQPNLRRFIDGIGTGWHRHQPR